MFEELLHYKHLIDIMLEEVNVKELRLPLGDTEKGKLELVYQKQGQKFFYTLDNSVLANNLPSETSILSVIRRIFIKK